MSAYVYIIYSPSLSKFYIGSTHENPAERLNQHNNRFFEKAFTTRGVPWQMHFSLECQTILQAICIEKHIKRMKSRRYIENLNIFPSIAETLLLRYKAS